MAAAFTMNLMAGTIAANGAIAANGTKMINGPTNNIPTNNIPTNNIPTNMAMMINPYWTARTAMTNIIRT